MVRAALAVIIVLLIIGTKFFFARSKVAVGILFLFFILYETYQGVGVLSKSPSYFVYGLLATVAANTLCTLLTLADKKNKITSFIKGSPLADPLYKWTTLVVLILLQIHLYAFLLYSFSESHPKKGDFVIPLFLTFVSSILLMNIYRNFRRIPQ